MLGFIFMESFLQHKSGRVFKVVSADSFNNKSFNQLRKGKDGGEKSTLQDVAPPATSSAAIRYLFASLAAVGCLHSCRSLSVWFCSKEAL